MDDSDEYEEELDDGSTAHTANGSVDFPERIARRLWPFRWPRFERLEVDGRFMFDLSFRLKGSKNDKKF